jgi:hypothetical protein
MQIFLALLIAHLAGDFLCQRRTVVDGKRAGRWTAYAEHGSAHTACLLLAWWLFAPGGLCPWRVAGVFAVIVGLHLLIDWGKTRLTDRGALAVFVLDQVIHLLVLLAAAWWLAGRPDWLEPLSEFWQGSAESIGWLLVAYVVVVVVFGWCNRMALASLLPETESEQDGLARAGLYIGWLERFLMFSAFLIQAWSILGLVLAAKSVFRFDSIRQRRERAEYFVIGTLLSVSEVMAVGLLVRWLTPTFTGGS